MEISLAIETPTIKIISKSLQIGFQLNVYDIKGLLYTKIN